MNFFYFRHNKKVFLMSLSTTRIPDNLRIRGRGRARGTGNSSARQYGETFFFFIFDLVDKKSIICHISKAATLLV